MTPKFFSSAFVLVYLLLCWFILRLVIFELISELTVTPMGRAETKKKFVRGWD